MCVCVRRSYIQRGGLVDILGVCYVMLPVLLPLGWGAVYDLTSCWLSFLLLSIITVCLTVCVCVFVSVSILWLEDSFDLQLSLICFVPSLEAHDDVIHPTWMLITPIV